MAIFEKRPGAPAGNITVNTAGSSYAFTDGGTVDVLDTEDINSLVDHPFVRLQGGTGGPFVPAPVIENVFLKDGILVRSRDQSAVSIPGSVGPAGTNWRGPWSLALPYVARDGVTWLGSSYVALNAVAAGGSNPGVDTTNWLKTTQGGGEIASASVVGGQNFATATLSSWTDITGLQIVVPAGAPAFLLEAFLPALAVNGSASNAAGDTFNVGLHVRDETGMAVAQSHFQVEMAAASRIEMLTFTARRIMPAAAVSHTYRASMYWTASRAGFGSMTLYSGPGTNTGVPTTDSGPSWIAATAR